MSNDAFTRLQTAQVAFNNNLFMAARIPAMHETMERLYRAAKELSGVEGKSNIARALNESPQNVNNWESRGVSQAGAIKAQQVFGANANWIVTGQGAMSLVAAEDAFESPAFARGETMLSRRPAPTTPPAPQPGVMERLRGYITRESGPTMQPILAWEHPDDLPLGEYVMIPRLDVHLSAGPGQDQIEIDFIERQPQAFRADWIRSERLKPSKLACLTASGNSMEPSIWDGDSLVVDTSQTEVQDGKVYALWYEGGERVKRLYRMPGGGLRIKSDNAEYEPIELTRDGVGHVRIIGRVVHRSGKGGL